MDRLIFMTTWVDTSYDVHNDMFAHTGGCISLGSGMIYCESSKQKLDVKISTESEFLGAISYLPLPIREKYFIEAQCYAIGKLILFNQDNTSGLKIEKNGKASSGQKIFHINIR